MLSLLKASGWLAARTPEPVLQSLAALLGDAIFGLIPRRRRLILSNLHHAFPERPAAWHRRVGRESCRRLIETGLLSLATPYLPERRLRRIVGVTPSMLAVFERQRTDPHPTLICSPHIAYWEAQTSMPLVVPAPFPEFGTIYRPLDNAAADEWVRRSREHFGMRLLSRKEGFAEALKILRRAGFVGLLFDQNAGMQGALTTLFGRVCSTTELPGILAEKFGARVYGIYPRRRAFWRLEIAADLVANGGERTGVVLALNRWLEDLLARDENICSSWLWAHDRWRHQDVPANRLRLESRRDLLAEDAAARGLPAVPRRTRFWVRLPNWLGDVVMVLPLLRALRASRPDAELTLVGRPQFAGLVESAGAADRFHALPPQGPGYHAHFRALRGEFVDTFLLFTNSPRGDLEARLAGAPQRFGIEWPGRRRPLLTHRWRAPEGDSGVRHQMDDWEAFLRHFGLSGTADRRPLAACDPGAAETNGVAARVAGRIGLIPGSENLPAKRWPVEHWRSLIDAMPDERFAIFGTAGDRPIAAAVADGHPESRVLDLSGATTLPQLAETLRRCTLLVTNDTGGMHLANAVGTPLVALFGPTNPQRTRPVFDAPVVVLQPPGCPPTGGAALSGLVPATVIAAVAALKANLSSAAESPRIPRP